MQTLLVQRSPWLHPPQFRELPHELVIVPHWKGWHSTAGQTPTLLVEHERPPEHDPQLTVRALPQLSAAVTDPQVLPRREQNAEFDSAAHTHALFTQLCPVPEHPPQFRVFPHAFVTVPHVLPLHADEGTALHAHEFELQDSSVPQPPQLREFPHAFAMVPHALPLHTEDGTLWHTQAFEPLQDSSAPHPPQFRERPHAFVTVPHTFAGHAG